LRRKTAALASCTTTRPILTAWPAALLPQALKTHLQAEAVETRTKARYSSGAPQAMLAALSADYDVAITGLAA
jgi:hypothetical protein